jgi:ubiquitin C-terminal hydrolase
MAGGIENYGSTCYLNAALQCLLAVPEFNASGPAKAPYAAIKDEIKRGVSPSREEIAALRDAVNEGRGTKANPKFAEHTHEDMQEFMMAVDAEPPSPFAFDIKYTYSCNKDGNLYSNDEAGENGAEVLQLRLGDQGKGTSILELMERHFADQDLPNEADDTGIWYTNRAHEKKRFVKTPVVLVVQLVRFMNEGAKSWKNEAPVTFEETLDLLPFTDSREPQLYDLIALSVHSGSKNGGHYWAFVKRGVWAKYDDNRVTLADFEGVLAEGVGGAKKSTAYVLVYRRR